MWYYTSTGADLKRAHRTDAGLDLVSTEERWLKQGQRALIKTGVNIRLNPGTCGLVCPRSGLANKYGITVLNAPGIIDAGYRGEVMVNLINLDDQEHCIQIGDRIAQLVVVGVDLTNPMLTSTQAILDLDSADKRFDGRGFSGHGSTGQ